MNSDITAWIAVASVAITLFAIFFTSIKYLDSGAENLIRSQIRFLSKVLGYKSREIEEKEIRELFNKEIEQLKELHKSIEAINSIDKLKSETISRLKEHLGHLNKKANLNLSTGLIFCLGGLIFIMYSLLTYQSTDDALTYFLPRIRLTIFIEIFSYFFLNLYKKNLEDIKYFQNEVTNLESKYLALLYAFESNNGQIKAKVIEMLMGTERNFILKKDETTIELEKSKIEAQSSNNTIQALKDIISFKK